MVDRENGGAAFVYSTKETTPADPVNENGDVRSAADLHKNKVVFAESPGEIENQPIVDTTDAQGKKL